MNEAVTKTEGCDKDGHNGHGWFCASCEIASLRERAERAERHAEAMAVALRIAYPAGSWCAHCGEGIDEPIVKGCNACNLPRSTLAAYQGERQP